MTVDPGCERQIGTAPYPPYRIRLCMHPRVDGTPYCAKHQRPPILPNGAWQILSDTRLVTLLHNDLTDEERDLVHQELNDRQAMRHDPRVAEALGAPWLKPS